MFVGWCRFALLLVTVLRFHELCEGLLTELVLGQETEKYTTECLDYKYFVVEAKEPCRDLKVEVKQIAGEPNLYISKYPTEKPTYRSLVWSSYNWGSDNVTISSWEPDYELTKYYIGVHAYCGSYVITNYTAAQYTVLAYHSTENDHPSGTKDLYGKSAAGNIDANNYTYHRFCVPDQCTNVTVHIEHCIDPNDEGCNGKYGHPELLVSRTIQQPLINDLTWKLADIAFRSVDLSPADFNFYPGHYYVGVYGWCTPDAECPDPDTCGLCSATEDLNYTLNVSGVAITQDQCDNWLSGRPPMICGSGQASVHLYVTHPMLIMLLGVMSMLKILNI